MCLSAGLKRQVQSLIISHVAFKPLDPEIVKQPLFRKQAAHSTFLHKMLPWETFDKKHFVWAVISKERIVGNYAVYAYSECYLPFCVFPHSFPTLLLLDCSS